MNQYQINSGVWLSALAWLSLMAQVSIAEPPSPARQLDSLIQRAWAAHPDLESMRQMVAAESSRTAMSSGWMNPELRLGVMNVPDNLKMWSDPMTMIQVGVMQRVPFPGKLKTASDAGNFRIKAASAEWDQGRYQMAGMLAMAYWDLAGAVAERSILSDGERLLDEMTAAATVMVGSGMSGQSDVHNARLEREEWGTREAANESEIARQRAVVVYGAGLANSDIIGDPQLPETLPAIANLAELISQLAIDASPEVRSALASDAAARRDIDVAQLAWYPDVDVMLAYGYRGDLKSAGGIDPMTGAATPPGRIRQDNMVTLELSAPVPLFYKGNQRARIQEMQAMASAKRAQVDDARIAKGRQIRELYAQWMAQRETYTRVTDGILPAAQDAFDASLADYRFGRTPFMTVSQARMALVMARMREVMLRADLWGISYQIGAALGKMPFEMEK